MSVPTPLEFYNKTIQTSPVSSVFSILLSDMSTVFTSHIPQQLEILSTRETVRELQAFIEHMVNRYEGTDISTAFCYYMNDRNKLSPQAYPHLWSLLYSLHVNRESSAEIRMITSAIELSRDKDTLALYCQIKTTLCANLCANPATTCLDDLTVRPQDLAQVLLAVFGDRTAYKGALLRNIQGRCDHNGIGAGELASMLMIDYLKKRDMDDKKLSKQIDKDTMDFARNKAKRDIIGRFGLKFPQAENSPTTEQIELAQMHPLDPERDLARSTIRAASSSPMTNKNKTESAVQPPSPRKPPALWTPLRKITATQLPYSPTQTSINLATTTRLVQTMEMRANTPPPISKHTTNIMVFNKDDMLRQSEYIIAAKAKIEARLNNVMDLIKINNKDYNELLKYALDMKAAMQALHTKVKTAKIASTISSSNDFTPPLPVNDKALQQYKPMDSLLIRTQQSEVSPLLSAITSDLSPVKTVSYPTPKHCFTRRNKSKQNSTSPAKAK